MYSKFRTIIRHQYEKRQLRSLHKRFRDWTMLSEPSFVNTLQIASQARVINGSIVQCGVWRGGLAAALSTVFGVERKLYLFDSFEGLPPAKEIDGLAAREWQADTSGSTFYDNCSAPPDYAKEAMEIAGASNVVFVKGWFEETIPRFDDPLPIAFLHLDADWYESTMLSLKYLFDRVAPGGVVVLDDYFAWDGCSRALHDFLSTRSARERIRTLGDICYLTKM